MRLDPKNITLVGRDAHHVDLVGCARYLGQQLPSGTRVDLRCSECRSRVATDADTVRFHAAGAALLCEVCVEAAVVRCT